MDALCKHRRRPFTSMLFGAPNQTQPNPTHAVFPIEVLEMVNEKSDFGQNSINFGQFLVQGAIVYVTKLRLLLHLQSICISLCNCICICVLLALVLGGALLMGHCPARGPHLLVKEPPTCLLTGPCQPHTTLPLYY